MDDDHIICRCLESEINWNKMECESPLIAHNGKSALEIMEKTVVDIVVSDIKMPIMDGTMLSKTIYEKYPNVSIIVISAYEDFKVIQELLRYKVKCYMMKPFNRSTIIELEKIIYSEVKHRRKQEEYRKLVSGEYQVYFETIIKENNMDALNEFLDRFTEGAEERDMERIDLWTNMLRPITEVFLKMKNIDADLIYKKENETRELLMSLKPLDRIEYVRQCYIDVMNKQSVSAKYMDVVPVLKQIIEKEFGSPNLNIDYLGKKVCLTAPYIGRIFYEQTGIKLIEYIIETRIKFACKQLSSSQISIKKIAEASGWPDYSYFNRIFRKKLGMTPLEYRQRFTCFFENSIGENEP